MGFNSAILGNFGRLCGGLCEILGVYGVDYVKFLVFIVRIM